MSFIKLPENTPVYELQTMLSAVVNESHLNPDGIFGSETKQAVSTFQKAHGLNITGEADPETWEHLRKAYHSESLRNSKAEPLQIVLQPKHLLKKEEENLHFYLIQAMLLALSELYLECPKIRITGKNDAQTQNAIGWFQKKAAIKPTGELDHATWQLLAHQYRSTVGDGSGSYPYRMTQRKISRPERVPVPAETPEK